MKELITGITGGRPFYNNDLTLLNDSIKEITSSLAKGLAIGETAFILTGCEITVNDSGLATAKLFISPGAIWYLDEIYPVDAVIAQSIPNVTQQQVEDDFEWDLNENVILSGTYKDGISNDLHNKRNAVLLASSVTWTGLSGLKNVSDLLLTKQATETLAGKSEIATISEVNIGSDNSRIVTPLGLKNVTDSINGGLKTKYIPINDWNMDSSSNISIAHNTTSSKIIYISAIIIADGGAVRTPLDRVNSSSVAQGGIGNITFSQVTLYRLDTGLFDSTDYNDLSFNRGYIIVTYID